MTVAADLTSLLYRDRGSPFAGFPAGLYAEDRQGWNSNHELLARTVREARPRLVVEIGVWKGASTITLAKAMREIGHDGAVLAVDTWLGSFEHWLKPNIFPDLKHVHGYPQLYYTFLSNVAGEGIEAWVVPLPIDSAGAHGILLHHAVRPDCIHIDAGHDYDSVTADLARWWERPAPRGMDHRGRLRSRRRCLARCTRSSGRLPRHQPARGVRALAVQVPVPQARMRRA